MRPLSRITVGVLVASCLASCQRGGSAASSQSDLVLEEIYYGRLLEEGNGPRIVSPLTTVETDPVTGLAIPGTLKPLTAAVDVSKLVALGLSENYGPRVVPRNCTFVLRFSRALDPTSVSLDEIDDEGAVLKSGAVQIRLQGESPAQGVRVAASVHGRDLWLHPVVDGQVGFPPSPIAFATDGGPVASANGFLRLRLQDLQRPDETPVPAQILRSVEGGPLIRRPDGLGAKSVAIGFNPGNLVLDFIGQDELIQSNETYNGFLPDETPPRIVRRHVFSGQLDLSGPDSVSGTSITDAEARFSGNAQAGMGEWAGRLLTLRPGTPTEEARRVVSNTTTTVQIAAPFTRPAQDGDAYELSRAEFFEPDLAHPIYPRLFDIDNPQNARNTQVANFVQAFEIDAAGNPLRGPLDLRAETLPAFSQLTVTFNEPMDASSFSPWETFQVTRSPAAPGEEVLSEVLLSRDQTRATIRPARRERVPGQPDAVEIVGWGPGVQALTLRISTMPSVGFLQRRIPSGPALQALLDIGHRGLTDAGGRPLAFPPSLFDVTHPVIEFSEPFSTDEAASSVIPPPVVQNWGVVVHRFQGRPITGIDPDTGESGVKFLDQTNYYTPIPDVNLGINGFLSGQPVTYITKIHDDYFRPPDGQFGAFPQGLGNPLRSYRSQVGPTGGTYDGIRFQHVYRDVDASPSIELAGTLLDLYRISWSPIGGNVSAQSDHYEDVSIYCAHSSYRPITQQNGSNANYPQSGLGRPFDFDIWLESVGSSLAPGSVSGLGCSQFSDKNEGPNYYVLPGNPTTGLKNVLNHASYTVRPRDIYTIAGSGNSWMPWPTFETAFQYSNGDIPRDFPTWRKDVINLSVPGGSAAKPFQDRRITAFQNVGGDSLLIEYRIQPQIGLVSGTNGFTFSLGILLTYGPVFRALSVGGDIDGDGRISGSERVFPDLFNDERARCASGPNIVNGGVQTFGDNSRYFMTFDYVKTTSVIESPYVSTTRTNQPVYFPPIIEPPLSRQPAGTTSLIEFDGHNKVTGFRNYGPDITRNNGKNFLSFRVTFVGDTDSLLAPTLDWVALPYLR